jgi:hypothetical protein
MILPEGYLVTKKVNVSEFFDGAEPDMSIEFRELDVQRTTKFQTMKDDASASAKYFSEVLPSVIVDHDFYRNSQTKYNAKEVADIIAARAELFFYVMNAYITEVLFTHGKRSAEK